MLQVWESEGPGVVRFSASDMGSHVTELGQIAEDITVHAAIYQSLSEYQTQGELLLHILSLGFIRMFCSTSHPYI